MEILIIAYVLTGIYKVVKTFRLPFIDRPAYARRPHIRTFLFVVIAWAFKDIGFLLSQYRRDPNVRRECVSNFLTFAVLVVLGFALL